MCLQLSGDSYQIANSLYETVAHEIQRNESLGDEDIARMVYYYHHLLDPKKSAFFKHHFAHRLAFILNHIVKGPYTTILDAACGMGTQGILYGMLGFKVTGIDLNRQDIGIAKTRSRFYSDKLGQSIDVIYEVANAVNYAESTKLSYDVIVIQEALCHIHPAEVFLDNVGNILSEGGLLIISETNALNPIIRWKMFRDVGTFGYKVRRVRDIITGEMERYASKRVFSVLSMRRMLRARGYEVVDARGSGFFPSVMARRSSLLKFMKKTERGFCLLPGHYLFGTSYTLVARKKR